MIKKNRYDSSFILEDPSMNVLITLSIPLIISNIIHTLYSLADGVWLAQLSSTQFAATSFTWPILFLFISLVIGMSIAGTSIIAQLIGANQKDRAGNYANHLIIMSFIVGIVFTIIGYFSLPYIIGWMGAKGDLYSYSLEYAQINMLGFVVDSLFFSFQAILNAQGKTRDTTLIGAFSGIVNILLDPILIFKRVPLLGIPGLGMGVKGAALATVLSKIVGLLIGWYKVSEKSSEVKVNIKGFRWNPLISKHISKVAVPTAIGRSSSALGFTILNGFIVSYGNEVVAAFSMVNRITDFWMQISMGIGAAMTSILAQNIGAKKYNRAYSIIGDAKKLVWITSITGVIILIIFNQEILSIFVKEAKDPLVYKNAMDYMSYAILIVPFMGLFNIYQGIFQGSGKTKYSMYMSMGRLWAIRIPLVVFFKNFTTIGQKGIWISMLLSNALIIFYSNRAFYKNKIIN